LLRRIEQLQIGQRHIGNGAIDPAEVAEEVDPIDDHVEPRGAAE